MLTPSRGLPLFSLALAVMLSLMAGAWLTPSASAQKKEEAKKKEDPKKKEVPKKAAPTTWRQAAQPIHIAAYEGELAALKKALAAKDVDVDARLEFRTFPSYTALHLAAYEGHAKAIEMIVAKKANLNLTEKNKKQTPLHIAAAYGRIDAARALIKAGADLNLKDKNGNTALKLATEKAIIAELKKAGATEE